MGYLVASVVLNALLSVIFKLFSTYRIDNFAAIVVNYIICFVIATIVTSGGVVQFNSIPHSWWPYLILLGSIFILTFNIVAKTIQLFGITIATLMQKMSVLLVVIFAVAYYREQLNVIRIIGLVAGFISIFLITGKVKSQRTKKLAPIFIALPIIVFFCGGLIDSTFVHVSRLQITLGSEDRFAGLLFGIAGGIGLVCLLLNITIRGRRYSLRDIVAGIVLGIPNFFTVYFIQKMLTSDYDGSVIFPIHNIAILLVSAIASRLLFSEKFGLPKYVGMILAIGAIVLLALGS